MLADFCTCIQLFVYSCPGLSWDLKTAPLFVLVPHLTTKQKGRFVLVSSPTSIFFPARVLDQVAIFDPWCGLWKESYSVI